MATKKVKSAKSVLIDHFTDELEYNEITYNEYVKRIEKLQTLPNNHDIQWYINQLKEV